MEPESGAGASAVLVLCRIPHFRPGGQASGCESFFFFFFFFFFELCFSLFLTISFFLSFIVNLPFFSCLLPFEMHGGRAICIFVFFFFLIYFLSLV
jgi:hypothetical protein